MAGILCKGCANFGEGNPRLLPLVLAVFTRARHSNAPAGNVARAGGGRQGRLENFKGIFLRPIPSKVELRSCLSLCDKFSTKKATTRIILTGARADFVDARPFTS
ncbi:MAG TPA: hypothetical protein DCQ92_06230 [Verrucomicrobia subdivision 3 bacterium]|nr:hypothetical protein [Limisphaerales bacterium]